jgi:integrase
LSRDEARRFAEAVAGDELEALYLLALTTGMRQGELLGLRWADVDLGGGMLAVAQQYKRLEDGRGMGKPKSAAGRRAIALTPFVVGSLRRRRAACRCGGDLVFCGPAGAPLQPEVLRVRHFYPLLERAGLPRVVFHELRHSAATILIAAGVPLAVVSRLLGHASIRITADLYGHIAVEDQAAATAAMGRLLSD